MCRKCHDGNHTCKKHHGKHNDRCVEEVLEAILEAQRKVKKEDECKFSCYESIKEVLEEPKKKKKDTIPFILYCGDCEPFKATGVTTKRYCHHKEKFVCINSFIFRINDLEDGCAVLELLTFKSDKKCGEKEVSSPCRQIDNENVDDLVGTGICINVDLSCVCAITCLPAVHLK